MEHDAAQRRGCSQSFLGQSLYRYLQLGVIRVTAGECAQPTGTLQSVHVTTKHFLTTKRLLHDIRQ